MGEDAKDASRGQSSRRSDCQSISRHGWDTGSSRRRIGGRPRMSNAIMMAASWNWLTSREHPLAFSHMILGQDTMLTRLIASVHAETLAETRASQQD